MKQNDLIQDQQQSHFGELCAALYERELHDLSWHGTDNPTFLKRRLASLPYYVRRAAFALLNLADCPLQLDVQNASWQAKQSLRPPAGVPTVATFPDPKLPAWLHKAAVLGLVMPVQYEQDPLIAVHLDSIDGIDSDGSKFSTPAVHLNRFGWFAFTGEPLEGQNAWLLRPSKRSISAACCGHQWSAAGRKAPRTLSLREVLLAATLNWKNFARVKPLPRFAH